MFSRPVSSRVEARPHLQQRPHPPVDICRAARRLRDPGQDLQQRALARPVPPDDAHHLAALDLEGYVLQRPDRLFRIIRPIRIFVRPLPQPPDRRLDPLRQRLPKGLVFRLALPQGIVFRQVLYLDSGIGHLRSHPKSA